MSNVFDLVEAFFVPQRIIDTFKADVTIEEVCKDESEITMFPVQSGAEISDHIFHKPSELNVEVIFSDNLAPLSETYANLLALNQSNVPFDVITGKRSYSNMLITLLHVVNDSANENILRCRIAMKQVNITSLSVVSVPPSSQQTDPQTTGATENAGQKSAQEASQPQSQSALSMLAG